jgi:hypothetical protein
MAISDPSGRSKRLRRMFATRLRNRFRFKSKFSNEKLPGRCPGSFFAIAPLIQAVSLPPRLIIQLALFISRRPRLTL